ncbi:MAG: WYL domain-containing transcriptional regulator [Bacilli bacterium]|nr:WYL domain-containing transcriptional regulator [Bacilli bacterium]
MLYHLNTGRVYKVSELADLLDTSPRNVIEYKKELDEALSRIDYGAFIKSIPGRYGGYQLNKSILLPTLQLLPEQKDVLREALDYIMTKKDFVKKKEAEAVFSKVLSSVETKYKDQKLQVVDHYQLTMDQKDIEERYRFIEEAIAKKRVIEIVYESTVNGTKTHILHPYKLFIYNNSWFFHALVPSEQKVWQFKINRIKEMRMLDQTFRVWEGFKPEDYFDGNGFTNNGGFYHCEFIVTGIRRQLSKERVYGKNQVVVDIDDERSRVTMDMQNEGAIVSYILGCGNDIEVIEPKWAIDRIKEVAENILEKYQTGKE